MIRTFQYRLQPTRRQAAEMKRILGGCLSLYNAALEQWKDAYRMQGKSLNYYDQARDLTELRASDPDYSAIPCAVEQDTLRRLDKSRQAFFRRVKRGERAAKELGIIPATSRISPDGSLVVIG